MLNHKNFKLLGSALACSILMSACTTIGTSDKDPKMAVQKGIQPLISKSFDFDANYTAAIKVNRVARTGKEKALQTTPVEESGTNEVVKMALNASSINIFGSVDQTAQKISLQASGKFKTDHLAITAKAPMLLDLKKSEFIVGLQDFNPVIFNNKMKQRYPDYLNKNIRIDFNNHFAEFFDQNNALGFSNFKESFDNIDQNKFSYIRLDSIDKKLKGHSKIRVALDLKTLENLFVSKPDDTAIIIDRDESDDATSKTTHPTVDIFTDFTLDTSGNVIRINVALNNLYIESNELWEKGKSRWDYYHDDELPEDKTPEDYILGDDFVYMNFNFDSQYKNFGNASFQFNPQTSETADISDSNFVKEILSDYSNVVEPRQINRTYGVMASIKTATEAALFEDKIPVATNLEEEKNPEKYEYIGWRDSDLVRKFEIKTFPRNPSRIILIGTLGNEAAQSLHGTQMVLSRSTDGSWTCDYYIGNKKDVKDYTSNLYSCTVRTKNFIIPKK